MSQGARLVALGLALCLSAASALGQLRLPEATSAPSDGWETVHKGSFSSLQIERDSPYLTDGALAYRVRDTGPPRWILTHCDTGERTDFVKPLRWTRPAHGTWAEADMLHACTLARQRALAVDRVPDWRPEEVAAVGDAWLYTAGSTSFDWRVAYFVSESDAQKGRMQRWGDGTRYIAPTRHAGSLVEVPPPLRRPLANLWSAGQRSPVLALSGIQGEPEWAVVEFVQHGPRERPSDAQDFRHHAAQWVGQGLIDAPATLLASPLHRARAAYRRARSAADVAQIDDALSPNLLFGDDLTPLTLAMLENNEPLARALLDRGADPNQCGAKGCPLHIAASQGPASSRLAWLQLLLHADAKPNRFDLTFGLADSTALASAAFAGDIAVSEHLLAAGASLDGAPGVNATPLELALAGGRREMAQWLITKGARVLPMNDRSLRNPARGELSRGNPWRAALEAKDGSLLGWIEAVMLKAARSDPIYAVEASIEQDGKRQPLTDGRTVVVKAAPFRLVFRLNGDDAAGVVLASSFSPDFATAGKKLERTNGLLIPSRSNALANVPDEDSYTLFAYEAPSANRPEGQHWGGHMMLQAGADGRRDFHAHAGHEYVREVRSVTPLPEDGTPPPATALAALKGRRLTLVFGSSLLLDPIEWAPWVQVRAVTLDLR